MNEFEWRRQMQQLRQPMVPDRDLWPGIDQAMRAGDTSALSASTGARTRRSHRSRWLAATGMAAAVLLSVGTGWHLLHENHAVPAAGDTMASNWKPADPRLAGAAIELDAARRELQQAMLQAPDSPALQRLLARTERQQAQLHQLNGQAG